MDDSIIRPGVNRTEMHPGLSPRPRYHDRFTAVASRLGTIALTGKSIQSIDHDLLWDPSFVNQPPGTRPITDAPPDRKDVELALESLLREAKERPLSFRDSLRFLCTLGKTLQQHPGVSPAWPRLIYHDILLKKRNRVRSLYISLLHQLPITYPDRSTGQWADAFFREHPDPYQLLETAINTSGTLMKQGPRASVWSARIEQITVVIKRYEPHPVPWRRARETCRARRAWIGAQLLNDIERACPRPIGWFHQEGEADQGCSYFVSEELPASEPVRSWLRREWDGLPLSVRSQFRHALRRELLSLYQMGLAHSDCKLSNLRIDPLEARCERWRFIWTDLEDVQPHRILDRVFIRNLYQMNGSLPRSIPLSDRQQFLKGFTGRFRYARSEWLWRYLRRVTRQRHRRELRRICGA